MRKIIITATAVTVLALAGCGQQWDDEHGKGDAPVRNQKGDDTPADVTNFPDNFGNVATKCVAGVAGWRAFVTTNGKGSSFLVVQADPACKVARA